MNGYDYASAHMCLCIYVYVTCMPSPVFSRTEYYKDSFGTWGDGSVAKVLTEQAKRPEFKPPGSM